LDLGIFNTVVADDALTSTVAELARHIAHGPAVALGYMKENINRASQAGLQECLALEADRLVRCAASPDHQEAVSAFMEKRQPVFNKP
jgi:enoyl-CoA hydratase/carnithine racemase